MEEKKPKIVKELTELEKKLIMADVAAAKELDKLVKKHNIKSATYKRPKGGSNV